MTKSKIAEVVEITYVTKSGSAYAKTTGGDNCYISVAMAEHVDVRKGDRYHAILKDNYEERQEAAKYIAVRLNVDHDLTELVGDDDDDDYDEETDEVLEEWGNDVTTDNEDVVVESEQGTDSLSSLRDQMFVILHNMSDGELDDMIIDVLTVEPMGFVDVLWSVLSINPMNKRELNELQRSCYTRVANRCSAMHKNGRLVEARYSHYTTTKKVERTKVYAVSMEQVNPTLV
tara:strand:- start:401 stop:1093 length:693 start_codon:yes stop_codon:yes gene_type:complete